MAIDSRYKLKTGEEVAYFPPIQNTDNPYLTEAAMHADQANQLEGYGYLVDGVGAFTYLGTLAGISADYKAFGGILDTTNLAKLDTPNIFTAIKQTFGNVLSTVAFDASATQEDVIPTIKVDNTSEDTFGGITQLLLKSGQAYNHHARIVYKALGSGSGDLYIIVGTTVVATFSRTGSVSFASTPVGLAGLNTNNIYTKRQEINSVDRNEVFDPSLASQKNYDGTFRVAHDTGNGGWAQIEIDGQRQYFKATRFVSYSSGSSSRIFYLIHVGVVYISIDTSDPAINFNNQKVKGIGSLDLTGLGNYTDDAAASTGGVAIGYAYINSATGAMHRRLT